jgi:hypothetical protein
MRTIVTALLLSMLLFNWFGYRLVIGVLKTQANSELEAQLDENRYDDAQLISIKVPVRYLPYYSNSDEFQRVDGQIEVGGVQYKYVKRRIYHDSLEMLCVPDHATMQLRTTENEFLRFSNDLAREKRSGDNPHGRKYFPIDNYTVQAATKLLAPIRLVTVLPAFRSSSLPLLQYSPIERPPEIARSLIFSPAGFFQPAIPLPAGGYSGLARPNQSIIHA